MRAKHFIYFILFSFLCNSCRKDEKIFDTHVEGTVTDYFDGNAVEGVTVAVVYTYSFNLWNCTAFSGCGEKPGINPDTLVRTTTNAKGEFKLKFRAKKNMDYHGVSNGPFGEPYKYGYLLIFYKNGTEYFKQFYNIDDGSKHKYELDYMIKPLVTFIYNISNNRPSDPVSCSFSLREDPDVYNLLHVDGTNITTQLILKTEFFNSLKHLINIGSQQSSEIYFHKAEDIIPTKKNYVYEITY